MIEKEPGRNEPTSPGELLSETAFIIVEDGPCLYEPSAKSAVRCVVPYGTELQIVRQVAGWVQVIAFGKKGWSPREHLAEQLEPPKIGFDVGVRPTSFVTRPSGTKIEFGPRGGRFVRTSSGFKRYL